MSHPREEVQKVKDHLKNGEKEEAIEHLDYLIHGLERQDRGESLDSFIRDLKRIKTSAMVEIEEGIKACDQLLKEVNRSLGSPDSTSSSDYKVDDTIGADEDGKDKSVISGSDIAVPDQEHIEEEIERLQKAIIYLEQRLEEVGED